MSKRFFVETKSDGRQQFVLQRSHSHGHHHHKHTLGHIGHHIAHHHGHHHGHHKGHHHGHHKKTDHGHVKIAREEWNSLLEREKHLEETNIVLAAENRTLKTDLEAVHAEAGHLTALVPQLKNEIAALYADNDALRRTVEKSGEHAAKQFRDMEKLECKLKKLEKEKKAIKEDNDDLRGRVKALSRQLDDTASRRMDDLVRQVEYWKDQFNTWKRRHEATVITLNVRTEKMEQYGDILRRRGII